MQEERTMPSQLVTENYKGIRVILDSDVEIDWVDEMDNFHALSNEVTELTEVLMDVSPRLSNMEARELAVRMLVVFGCK